MPNETIVIKFTALDMNENWSFTLIAKALAEGLKPYGLKPREDYTISFGLDK